MEIENIKKLYDLNEKRKTIIEKLNVLKRCRKNLGYDTKIIFKTFVETYVKIFFQSVSAGFQSSYIGNYPNDNNDKYHKLETNCIKEVFDIIEKTLNKELEMVENDIKELK